jgi:hypothetical protein
MKTQHESQHHDRARRLRRNFLRIAQASLDDGFSLRKFYESPETEAAATPNALAYFMYNQQPPEMNEMFIRECGVVLVYTVVVYNAMQTFRSLPWSVV